MKTLIDASGFVTAFLIRLETSAKAGGIN